MSLTNLLRDIERSVNGDAWHGPSIREAVHGLSAREAARTPSGDAHSIWEIVLHAAAWMEEVADRLRGEPHDAPVNGDWALAPAASDEAWNDALLRLSDSVVRLQAAVLNLDADRLDEPAVPGRSTTFRETLAGAAQHNAYHAGQITILRKLLTSGAAAR